MAKANTLSELADNITERQMSQREVAAVDRQEMSAINKKIHAFGGEAMVFDHISQGKTVDSVIKALDVSISGFYKWIERDAKRGELLARARTRGGQSLAEQTLEIADSATPQEAQVAKLRVDTRRWLASKMNEDYSDKQQPLVSIDLGSMALDALRKRSITHTED
jgi:predicted XRE-type DNA-binding protein